MSNTWKKYGVYHFKSNLYIHLGVDTTGMVHNYITWEKEHRRPDQMGRSGAVNCVKHIQDILNDSRYVHPSEKGPAVERIMNEFGEEILAGLQGKSQSDPEFERVKKEMEQKCEGAIIFKK